MSRRYILKAGNLYADGVYRWTRRQGDAFVFTDLSGTLKARDWALGHKEAIEKGKPDVAPIRVVRLLRKEQVK